MTALRVLGVAAVSAVLLVAAESAAVEPPSNPDGELTVVAEGEMRSGGTWELRASASTYERTLCWMVHTQNTYPTFPPLPAPTTTEGRDRLGCDTRPRRSRLGHYVTDRRCDADTALIAGAVGSGVRKVVLRFADGSRRRASPVLYRPSTHAAARGYYLLSSSETPPTQVLGFNRRGKRVDSQPLTWAACDDPSWRAGG